MRPSFGLALAGMRGRWDPCGRVENPDENRDHDQLEHAVTALEVPGQLRDRREREPSRTEGGDQLRNDDYRGGDSPDPVAPAAPRVQPFGGCLLHTSSFFLRTTG